MDEVFGYFPPTANPPTKTPMLTLLKQARAFGLGVVLATQNPVDLDYKGLSNAGTWLLGRLQTERDKLRVLEGLEARLGGRRRSIQPRGNGGDPGGTGQPRVSDEQRARRPTGRVPDALVPELPSRTAQPRQIQSLMAPRRQTAALAVERPPVLPAAARAGRPEASARSSPRGR